MRRSRSAPRVVLVAALLGIGETALGGAQTATAQHALDSNPAGSHAATATVAAYLDAHPRPASLDGAGAPVSPAALESERAFLLGFPFDAALAQWGCRSVGAGVFEVDGGFAAWMGADCEGTAPPTLDQVITVRGGAAAPNSAGLGAGRGQGEPEWACEVIDEGSHCMDFRPDQVSIAYQWRGAEPIDAILRLGRSTLPAPGCDPGSLETMTPVVTLKPRDSVQIIARVAGSANWSNSIGAVSAEGAVRVLSTMCRFGPDPE